MKKNNDSKKDDNNYAKKDKKNKGIWIVNITVRRSRQSGVARATCPD